jgi:predicted lipoprotein with Yx(FWY)xxD motif
MMIRLRGLAMHLTMGLAMPLALLASCGEEPESASDQPDPTPSPTSSAPPPTPTTTPPTSPAQTSEPTGPRIVADDSEFGSMLFDGDGQAIYLFDVETTAKPACYDACAEAWPPVLTDGKSIAGKGVQAALLGTTKRTDGTVQVTYNDHPLYYYAHEAKGEVKCHDVFLNGGNWYVVQPNGDAAPPG